MAKYHESLTKTTRYFKKNMQEPTVQNYSNKLAESIARYMKPPT